MNLPYAFHSVQIKPILDKFEKLAGGAIFNKPTITVILPLLSQVIETNGVFNPAYLSRYVHEPVNFTDAIRAAADIGLLDMKIAFVEVNLYLVCTAMIKVTFRNSNLGVPSLHKAEDPWKTLLKSLCSLYDTGLNID